MRSISGALSWNRGRRSFRESQPPGAFWPIVFTTPQPCVVKAAVLAPCDVPHRRGVRKLCRVPVCASANARGNARLPTTSGAELADGWNTVHGCRQHLDRNVHGTPFRRGTPRAARPASEPSICEHRECVHSSCCRQLGQQDLAGSGHLRAHQRHVHRIGGLHQPRPDHRSGGTWSCGAQRDGRAAGLYDRIWRDCRADWVEYYRRKFDWGALCSSFEPSVTFYSSAPLKILTPSSFVFAGRSEFLCQSNPQMKRSIAPLER